MRNAIFVLAMFTLCVGASGCASISSKKTQTLVETIPDKAECNLVGENYKQFITTPSTLDIPAKSAPVTIICTKEGYFQATEQIDTKMDGFILGNILMGGLIGAAIDAGTGAGKQYPEKVVLVLNKRDFFSQEEMDAWYGNRDKEINAQADREIQAIDVGCPDNDREICARKVKKVNELRETRLLELKKKKDEAKIIAKPEEPLVAPVIQPAKQEKKKSGKK